jgi:hypothetical protein
MAMSTILFEFFCFDLSISWLSMLKYHLASLEAALQRIDMNDKSLNEAISRTGQCDVY